MVRPNLIRKVWVAAIGALTFLAATSLTQEAAAVEKLSLATLAPKPSPWGKVFEVWRKAVNKKSDGKVELEIFYNGQMGDEGAMIGKMRSNQLDGAAVTAVGLSKIHAPILALQMPGLATSWDKLDKMRDALKGDFESGMDGAGFKLVGWGDVGQAHVMSKGFAVRTPGDMSGKKPYMWRDDSVGPVLYQVMGVTPVPLNVPEVLPSLSTGSVNVVTAPALAAEQLQWASHLDHIGTDVAGTGIGAVVFSKSRLSSMPGDLRSIVVDTGSIAAKALTQKIRDEDKAAFDRMKGRMTVVTLNDSERAAWKDVFKKTRQRLGQGTFDAGLVSRLEGIAGL